MANVSRHAHQGFEMKTWRDIDGWYGFADCYKLISERIPDGGTFVELGSWMGQSFCAMHELLQQENKTRVEMIAVDTFEGAQTLHDRDIQKRIVDAHGGNIYTQFRDNLRACGIEKFVVMIGDTAAVSTKFKSKSVDAVFVDAGHSEDEVRADILAWVPKIKIGGLIAGDDYTDESMGVKAAVTALFHERHVKVIGRAWLVQL
jgi:hypothetical protein